VHSGVGHAAASDSAHSAVLLSQAKLQDALEEVQNRRAQLLQRRADLALARAQSRTRRCWRPSRCGRRAPGGPATTSRPARRSRASCATTRCGCGWTCPSTPRSDPQRPGAAREFEDGTRVEGQIARLSPELSAKNRTLRVEGELPNREGALRSGSFARVEVVLDPAARTLVVPPEALLRFAASTSSSKSSEGKALERRVRVGRSDGQRIEILEGIAAGAELVLQPGNLQAARPCA